MKTIFKNIIVILVVASLAMTFSGCQFVYENINQLERANYYNATEYGVLTTNSGKENSGALQELINSLPICGTIYIPSGRYEFAEIGQQKIGSHCIKMRSDVNIIGDGESTVLLPVGNSSGGLDMFYFNELIDNRSAEYLQNCTFKDFRIDASGTSPNKYTSAGKGFMFNLCRNCRWENVIVENTDATGFGIDCPINCTIINCMAINCGKAATVSDHGASGYGIGFGFSAKENMKIVDCYATGNKKFGFFFEHQGRFKPELYQANSTYGFLVNNCKAIDNYYNFGGMKAIDVTYSNCISKGSIEDDFYFYKSTNCVTINNIQN